MPFIRAGIKKGKRKGSDIAQKQVSLPRQQEEKYQCAKRTEFGHVRDLPQRLVDLLNDLGLLLNGLFIKIGNGIFRDDLRDGCAGIVRRCSVLIGKIEDQQHIQNDQNTKEHSQERKLVFFYHAYHLAVREMAYRQSFTLS